MADPAEGDHSADIFDPELAYEAPMPPKPKEFLPWHRPRKQYVREHQWCAEIKRLIDATPPIGGVLKYLGLPGVDLLDLRHFNAAVCQPRGLSLRFLGFNASARPRSPANAELNISMDEVRRMPGVDPQSEVIGDNFARVAVKDSLACRRARALGPYDVINLDLCDGFGAQPPGTLDNSYYDGVSSLLAIQARSTNPWLLLLTTRSDKPNINEQVLERLLKKYVQNLGESAEFREASRDLLQIETADAVNAAANTPAQLVPLFLTGLCKWFAGLTLGQNPPTTIEVRSVMGYKVDAMAQCEDLISVAIKFTPTFAPGADPLGLANTPVAAPNEGTLAMRALKRIAKRVDADQKLADDKALLDQMVQATADLLSSARYDADAYRAWATT
jgi:hypothetical protein